MSYSFPYGNSTNTNSNGAISNTNNYNEFAFNQQNQRHNTGDQHLYQLSQSQQTAFHQQQSNYPTLQPQIYQQITSNESNRQPDMNYAQRYSQPPFIAERPPGPQQFQRQQQNMFFQVPTQRLPQYPTGIIVDYQAQPMYQPRPIQIVSQNGQVVNAIQPHVATPPQYYDPNFQAVQSQTMQTAQGPFQQSYVQPFMYNSASNPLQQQWTTAPTSQPATMSAPIPAASIPQSRFPTDTTQATIMQTAQIPQTTQYPRREKKPLLIVNPNTNQPIDVQKGVNASATTQQTDVNHIGSNKTTDNTTNIPQTSTNQTTNRPFTNSISLNSISTTATSGTVSNSHRNYSQIGTSNTNVTQATTETQKSKQEIQTEFSIKVLRCVTENEKQKQQTAAATSATLTATTTSTTTTASLPPVTTTIQQHKPITITTPVTTNASSINTNIVSDSVSSQNQGIVKTNDKQVSPIPDTNTLIDDTKTDNVSNLTNKNTMPINTYATVIASQPPISQQNQSSIITSNRPATEVPKSAVATGPRHPNTQQTSIQSPTTNKPIQSTIAKPTTTTTTTLLATTITKAQIRTTTTTTTAASSIQSTNTTNVITTTTSITQPQSISTSQQKETIKLTDSQGSTSRKSSKRESKSRSTSSSISPSSIKRDHQLEIENKKDNIEVLKTTESEFEPTGTSTKSPTYDQIKQLNVQITENAEHKSSLEISIQSSDENALTDDTMKLKDKLQLSDPESTGSKQLRTSDTEEQIENKKRYDRDFLMSMKDKQTATLKPKDLPNIPNVVIDNPLKASQQPVRSTASMEGGYYGGRGSTGRGRGQMKPGGGGGSGISRHGSMQQKVIDVPSNSDIDKVLNKSENPYIPSINDPSLKGTEKVLREVRAILNKITPQKFTKLAADLTDLDINTEDRLRGAIDIIFEKAIDEPAFSQMYATLCKCVSTIKVPPSVAGEKPVIQFRTLLLIRCQKEFDTDFYKEINYEELNKAVEECQDEVKKRELREQLEEKLIKAKRRSLGNIRFIGELFKLGMLTEGIMYDCIARLLKNETDEENLECLCRLLTTIGKDLEKGGQSKPLKEHFDRLIKIQSRRPSNVSARIRFMILDVMELKNNNWIPRRQDNAPKTIDEIHREVEEEQIRSQQEITRLQQLEASKRSSIGQGPKGIGGKGFQQQSGIKSTSMDADYAHRTKQNMANKIKDVKMNISSIASNQTILLGPPRFSKSGMNTSSTTTTQNSKNIQSTSQTFDYDSSDLRRGSIPLQPTKQKPYVQQYSTESLKRDKKLENVRQMDRYSNKSEASSRASSRDTSVSRPSDSRDNSVTRSSDIKISGSDLNIAPVKPKRSYTSAEIERFAVNMIEEYLNNDDVTEALKDFEDFQPIDSEQIDEFIRDIFQVVLERTEAARLQTGKLFYNALKNKKLDQKAFVNSLKTTFESVEDMAIDLPHIGNYLGDLISPLIQEDISIEFLKEIFEPIINTERCAEIISYILHKASNRLGHNTVLKIFKNSNLNVYDFLNCVSNLTEFLNKNNLQFLIQNRDRTQSASVSIDSYENKLNEILIDPKTDNEKIFDNIENSFLESDCQSSHFVRALMTAVCRSCIIDNKIDQELFKKRGHILTKFIARNDSLELESLFAIQALDFQLKHQPGFIRVIFDMLYDEDIISEEAFRSWQMQEREDGHAISVLSLKAFFDWLDETEATES